LSQGQQQLSHPRVQHMALAHIGHVARAAFVKSDQDPTLFRDVANRQASPVAIAPGRAGDRAENDIGRDVSQMMKLIFQCTLLHRDLGKWIKMLH
jgi:hypothetical protein